jgi:hypothetical protein
MGKRHFQAQGAIKIMYCSPAHHRQIRRKHRFIFTKKKLQTNPQKIILKFLHNQKVNWKQRYIVRWTKLGDESTKIFHATATERYILNTITSLTIDDDKSVSDHCEKAALLWEEYRNRLGQSVQIEMHFDLSNLIQQHCLHSIETPFTKEDIDRVVAKLPSYKSPGLDGFNGLFIKKVLAHNQRGHI